MDIFKMSKMENLEVLSPEKRVELQAARRCFDPRNYADFFVTN